MNERLKQIVKKVILGATASLSAATLSSQAKTNEVTNNPASVQSEIISYDFKKESETPKLVLKKPSAFSSIRNFFQHRSHASHSSHASHASHVSGYTSPNINTQPEVKEKSNNAIPKPNTKNQLIYELGSRILEKGMKGTDVVELQEILIKKGYFVHADGEFGETTEEAVKKFQKDNKLEVTGKVDVATLYHLKKKE